MKKQTQLSEQLFIPIILGSSIGVYSIARSFHEAYGIKSIAVCRTITGPINHSSIIYPMIEENMEEANALLSFLKNIDRKYPNKQKVLIGSDDWHVELIVEIKDKLDSHWVVPYTNQEILQKVIDKESFYNLCEKLGVDYPNYISLGNSSTLQSELPFPFPVVVKPSSRTNFDELEFVGKKKVYVVNNKQDLDDTISIVRNAGYHDNLIIQEFVPGDDTAMHILTLYITNKGEINLASFGQTLLEDHTPGGIGNPLVIRTMHNEKVIKDAEKIVKHVGYNGVANFDLKYDKRDGKYKFFELNPRLGRSNYYVTAQGQNPVKNYIAEYIDHKEIKYSIANNEVLYSIIPKRLLLKYIESRSLKDKIKKLYKEKKVKNPMIYLSVDKSIKRIFYVFASTFNFYRKFKKYPPLKIDK